MSAGTKPTPGYIKEKYPKLAAQLNRDAVSAEAVRDSSLSYDEFVQARAVQEEAETDEVHIHLKSGVDTEALVIRLHEAGATAEVRGEAPDSYVYATAPPGTPVPYHLLNHAEIEFFYLPQGEASEIPEPTPQNPAVLKEVFIILKPGVNPDQIVSWLKTRSYQVICRIREGPCFIDCETQCPMYFWL